MTVSTTKKLKKHRRFRAIIISCLILVPFLTFLETKIFSLSETPFPISGNVLVFILININVLLLLLVVFLVLRRLVELIFERRQRLLGSKLRTKLVISFVSLSLIPTILLFFIALQFVSTSMDYWFNSNVDQSLQESLDIAKDVYQDARKKVIRQGKALGTELNRQQMNRIDLRDLEFLFNNTLATQDIGSIELLSDQRKTIIRVTGEQLTGKEQPEIADELLRAALESGEPQTTIQTTAEGELVRSLMVVALQMEGFIKPHVLVTSLLIPKRLVNRMSIISKGLEGYRQLVLLKNPIKTSLLVMLLIVTLLIIFSAVWFGFYVAQGLTGPIGKLAEATRRVAVGRFDFVLEKEADDEMGLLVDSFNKMTGDILNSRQELEKTNLALQESYLELDERRRYIEILLQNVAAGVISFDKNRKITTINRFAEKLLKIDKKKFLDKDYRQTLNNEHIKILESFLDKLYASGKPSIQQPLRLSVRNETFSLLVNFTKLEDDQNNPLGVVLVFDNLTQLEKAQRAAAWREVAKRIAHEVKNPLTPIQLSAQRLRKRYLDNLGSDGEVFDLCTQTIINQVEELKRLVSEFSNFARMPAIQKAPGNLPVIISEVLILYQHAHKDINFIFDSSADVPSFSFDSKQLKQVLINLLDNSVCALQNTGTVHITLTVNQEQKKVYLEVKDNGPGVKDKDKLHLFEPYFSTKKTGTGLGLAIASTIISDHDGYIRVKDNEPTGAIFVIELPLQS
jgi:two-component system nitrogen regulation sensor histidine kinase NtrY